MIIKGKLLVDAACAPEPGWIRMEGNRIAELGSNIPPEKPELGDDDCIICPGFIDAHLHLPQIRAVGCDGLDLLQWLDRVIYPAEMQWSDVEHARVDIITAYRRMVRAGTLGFAGYLTSHPTGPTCLIDSPAPYDLPAHLGQILMDRQAPDALTSKTLADLSPPAGSRINWSINPRFAVACNDEMLAQAANMAGGNVFIQTHLAESKAECELISKLFPDDPHYTGVYDRHGLLTGKSLLAHSIHLSDEEWELIARRESIVVHCPTANTFLSSGLFNLDSARDHGVSLALGSDIAAGPDIAMPRVGRAMIEVAKIRGMMQSASVHIPSPVEVWNLITHGNADALNWPDCGRLSEGSYADLLVLKPDIPCDEFLIGRLIYTWQNRYIKHRVIGGQLIENAELARAI